MKISINGKRFSDCDEAIDFLTEFKSENFSKVESAIKTISDYCNSHDCVTCFFERGDGECMFQHATPENWGIECLGNK